MDTYSLILDKREKVIKYYIRRVCKLHRIPYGVYCGSYNINSIQIGFCHDENAMEITEDVTNIVWCIYKICFHY